MKKLISFVVCVVMTLALCSCSEREVNYAKSPEKTEVSRGAWANGVYSGDFTDLSFRLPAGWEILSDDEIATVSGDKTGLTYDMMCQNNATGSVITVIYEDLLLSAGTNRLTEDEYIDTVSDNLSGMGLSIVKNERVSLGKHEFLMLKAHGEGEGISLDQCSLVRKSGGYMISVIVTASNGDDAEELLKLFY